jgi:hypothetical protein
MVSILLANFKNFSSIYLKTYLHFTLDCLKMLGFLQEWEQ